jgi:hypothetical protein
VGCNDSRFACLSPKKNACQEKYEKFASAVLPWQAFFRMVLAKHRYKQLEREGQLPPPFLLMFIPAKSISEGEDKPQKMERREGSVWAESKKSTVRIQAIVRGFIQRP